MEASGPVPAGNSNGKTIKRTYSDVTGLLTRNSVYIGSSEYAYTRYAYPDNGIQSQVYSTHVETDGGGPGSNDELLTETWSDGGGPRSIGSRSTYILGQQLLDLGWSANGV